MMYTFYVGDGLLYPMQFSEQDIRAGVYLPLAMGGMMHAQESEGRLRLKMISGSREGGVILGIKRGSEWANGFREQNRTIRNESGLVGGWIEGMSREEASLDIRSQTAPVIGTVGAETTVMFGGASLPSVPDIRIDPEMRQAPLGSKVEYEVTGLGLNDTVSFEAEHATMEVDGNKVTLTLTSLSETATLTARVALADGRRVIRMATGLAIPLESDKGPEAPTPPEPEEPATESSDKIEYETVLPFVENRSYRRPVVRKVTHRRRGPRESEKLNAFLVGVRREIEILNDEEGSLREGFNALKEGVAGEGADITSVRSEIERILIIEKPRGVGILRTGVRPKRIISVSAKLNKASLNLSDYTINEHGIMQLSDQLKEESGRLEVEIRYEREGESPVRLSMVDLQRRARRLNERIARVKEGLEHG